jgi:hypothetical protein
VSPSTLGKDAVSVTRCRDDCFSLPSTSWHSAKTLPSAREKSTRQRRLCRCTVCRALFAECGTRQRLCRVFLRLCASGTRQRLCRVLEKKYSAKKALSMHCVSSPVCRVRHSAKTLPSVFKTLCFRHSAKPSILVVSDC